MDASRCLLSLSLATLALAPALNAQGRALGFDGVSDLCTILDANDDFDLGSSFTLEAWIRPDSLSGSEHWIAGNVSPLGLTYGLKGFGAQLAATAATSTFEVIAFAGSLTAGEWTHVAATYDGATILSYVNGVQVGSASQTGNTLPVAELLLGAFNGDFTTGRIDEVRIWNSVRTGPEIAGNYASPLGGDHPDLVGYYKFEEENSSQDVLDSSIHGNHGVRGSSSASEASDPSRVDSDIPYCTEGAGGALLFDGVDDLAVIADLNDDFDLGSSFTLEFWARVDVQQFSGILGGYLPGSSSPWQLQTGSVVGTTVEFSVWSAGGSGFAYSDGAYTTGVWAHYAATYDGTDVVLYKNGVPIASAPHATGEPALDPIEVWLGKPASTAPGFHFAGALDEVRIWNVARTPQQIAHFCNLPLLGPLTGLVGLYKFDEFGGQTILDSSGLDNHGVLGMTVAVDVDDPIRIPSGAPFCPEFGNDDCGDAFDVSAGGQYFGTLYSATNDGSDGCGGIGLRPDVWYRFTAPESGELSVSTRGTNDLEGIDGGVDTVLALFDGCGGNQLACSDDFGGTDFTGVPQEGLSRDSSATISVTGGDDVLIRVARFGTTRRGHIVLSVLFEPVFPNLCNGDGGDQLGCTDCPCSNNAPFGTIGGCLNSSGNSTRIAASGDTSVSLPPGVDTDLRIELQGAPAGAFCVLQSGDAIAPQNIANPCFGTNAGLQSADRDGLRCAVQGTLRHGGRVADGTGAVADSAGASRVWGGESGPSVGLAAPSGFVSGQTRYFQVTHRENAMLSCMRGLNTSQAVEVVFTP